MILTGKGCLGLDIWLETPQQAESTENMMRTIWNMEAMRGQKNSEKPNCPLATTSKEARHVQTLLFYDLFQQNR